MDILTHKYLSLHTPNPVNYFFSRPSGCFSKSLPFHPSESFVLNIAGSNLGDVLINRPNERCVVEVEDSSESTDGLQSEY